MIARTDRRMFILPLSESYTGLATGAQILIKKSLAAKTLLWVLWNVILIDDWLATWVL